MLYQDPQKRATAAELLKTEFIRSLPAGLDELISNEAERIATFGENSLAGSMKRVEEAVAVHVSERIKRVVREEQQQQQQQHCGPITP